MHILTKDIKNYHLPPFIIPMPTILHKIVNIKALHPHTVIKLINPCASPKKKKSLNIANISYLLYILSSIIDFHKIITSIFRGHRAEKPFGGKGYPTFGIMEYLIGY